MGLATTAADTRRQGRGQIRPQPVFEVLRSPVHVMGYSRGIVDGMGIISAC